MITLKRKVGTWTTKLSRLAFSQQMLANHFSLLDTKKLLRIIRCGRSTRFSFAASTISNLQKLVKTNFLGADKLPCFISINN